MGTRIFPITNTDIDTPFDEDYIFNTVLSQSEGGREYRYDLWQYPKRAFAFALSARNASEVETLWEFYRDMRGNYDSFYWENPNESSESATTAHGPVTNNIFATGDGSTAIFYIGSKFLLPTGDCHIIPSSYTIQHSIGGTGDYTNWAETTNYTISVATGAITPVSTLANTNTLRASYRFYYSVRFKDAKLSKRAFAYKLWNIGMELIQVI